LLLFFSINLAVASGSLVAVVGPVGSGKSSLLSSLIGEMEVTGGKVHVQVYRLMDHYCYTILEKNNNNNKINSSINILYNIFFLIFQC
jgi:ABC-type hemin transport system ATPase subunit